MDIKASISAIAGNTIGAWAKERARSQWGIFTTPEDNQAPKPVLSAAHIETLTCKNDYKIASYRQEESNFTSYNKVKSPSSFTVRMICDGSESGEDMLDDIIQLPSFLRSKEQQPQNIRKSFLNTLEKISGDTNLYRLRTPEKNYPRVNIIGYEFKRTTTSGVTMIIAEITLQEVLSAGTFSQTTTPRSASGAQVRNCGVITGTTK